MIGRRFVVGLLRFYQRYLSPLLPAACRFQPTCSEYAIDAVQLHGTARGMWLGLCRLLRCHPFSAGGFDPVPVPAGHDHRPDRPGEIRETH